MRKWVHHIALSVAGVLATTGIAVGATLTTGWNLVHPGAMDDTSSLGSTVLVYDAAAEPADRWSQAGSLTANQGAWVQSSAEGTFTVTSGAGGDSYSSITSPGWYLLGSGDATTNISSIKSRVEADLSSLWVGKIYAFSGGQWLPQDLTIDTTNTSIAAGQGLWVGVVSTEVQDIGSPPSVLFSGIVSLDTTGQSSAAGRRLAGRTLFDGTTGSTTTVGETKVQLYAVDDEDFEIVLTKPIEADANGGYEVTEEDFLTGEIPGSGGEFYPDPEPTSSYAIKAAVSTIEVEEDGTVKAKVIEVSAIKPETAEGETAEVIVDPVTTYVANKIKDNIKTMFGGSFTISDSVQSIVNSLAGALVVSAKEQISQGTLALDLDDIAVAEVEVKVDAVAQAEVATAYRALKVARDAGDDTTALQDALNEKKAALQTRVAEKEQELDRVEKIAVRQAIGETVADSEIEDIADQIATDDSGSGGAVDAASAFSTAFAAETLTARREAAESSMAKTGANIGKLDAQMAKLEQAVQEEQIAALDTELSALKGSFGAGNIDGNIQMSRMVYNTIADLARMEFAVSDGGGNLVVHLPVAPEDERMLPGSQYRIAVNITAEDNQTNIPTGVQGESCSASTFTDPASCLSGSGNTWTTYVGDDVMLRQVNPETHLRTPHPSWAEDMMDMLYTPIIPNAAVYSMIKNRNETVTLWDLNREIIQNAGGTSGDACKDSADDTNVDCFENLYYDDSDGANVTGVRLASTDPYEVAKQIVAADMATHLKGDLDGVILDSIDRQLHGDSTPLQVAQQIIDLLKPATETETADGFLARAAADTGLIEVVTDDLVDTLSRAIPLNHTDTEVLQLAEGFEIAQTTKLVPKTAVALTVLMADKFVGDGDRIEMRLTPANEIDELQWMLGDALARVLNPEDNVSVLSTGDEADLAALVALLTANSGDAGAQSTGGAVTEIWWPHYREFSTAELEAMGVASEDVLRERLNNEGQDDIWSALFDTERAALEDYEATPEAAAQEFDGDDFILGLFQKVNNDKRLQVENELKDIYAELDSYISNLEQKMRTLFGDRAHLAGFDAIDEFMKDDAYGEVGTAGTTSVDIVVRDGFNWSDINSKVEGVRLIPMVFDRFDMIEHPEYAEGGTPGPYELSYDDQTEGAAWMHSAVKLFEIGRKENIAGDFYELSDLYRVYIQIEDGGEWMEGDIIPLFPMAHQNLDVAYWGNAGDDGGFAGVPGDSMDKIEVHEIFHKDRNDHFFYPGIKIADMGSVDGEGNATAHYYVGEEVLGYDGSSDTISPLSGDDLRGMMTGTTVQMFVLAKNHEERESLYDSQRGDLTDYIQEVMTGQTTPIIRPGSRVGFFDGYWPERGCSTGQCTDEENESYDQSQYGAGNLTHGGLVLVNIVADPDPSGDHAVNQQLLLEVDWVFEDSNWHEVSLMMRSTEAEKGDPDNVGIEEDNNSYGNGMSIHPDGELHNEDGGWNSDFSFKIDLHDDVIASNSKNRLFVVVREMGDGQDTDAPNGRMALFVNNSDRNLSEILSEQINLNTLLDVDSGGDDNFVNKTGEFINSQGWLEDGNTPTTIGQAVAGGFFDKFLKAQHLDGNGHYTIDAIIVRAGYDKHAVTLTNQLSDNNSRRYDWWGSLIEQFMFDVLMPAAKSDAVFQIFPNNWSAPNPEHLIDWSDSAAHGVEMHEIAAAPSTGLATGESLYIANEGFGGGGMTIARLAEGGALTTVGDGFNGVAALVEAPNGDLYISDDRPAVYRLASGATTLEELPIRHQLHNPNGLAISADGNELAIAESGNGTILTVDLATDSDSNGTPDYEIRELASCYDVPQAVAYGSNGTALEGDILFTDFSGSLYRIEDGEPAGCWNAEHYTPDWIDTPIPVTEFGFTSDRSGSIFPSTQGGLVIASDGTAYVADYSGGVYRIAMDDSGDQPVAASAEEILRVNGWYPTRGLALSSDENKLYVTAYDHQQVLMLDLSVTDGDGDSTNADEIAASVHRVADDGSILQGPFGLLITDTVLSDLQAAGGEYVDPNAGLAFMDTSLENREVGNINTSVRGKAELLLNPSDMSVAAKVELWSDSGVVPTNITVALYYQTEACMPSYNGTWAAVTNCPHIGDFSESNGEWQLGSVALNDMQRDALERGDLFILVKEDGTPALSGRIHLPHEYQDDLRHAEFADNLGTTERLEWHDVADRSFYVAKREMDEGNVVEAELLQINFTVTDTGDGEYSVTREGEMNDAGDGWNEYRRSQLEETGRWWVDPERGALMMEQMYEDHATELVLTAREFGGGLRLFSFEDEEELLFSDSLPSPQLAGDDSGPGSEEEFNPNRAVILYLNRYADAYNQMSDDSGSTTEFATLIHADFSNNGMSRDQLLGSVSDDQTNGVTLEIDTDGVDIQFLPRTADGANPIEVKIPRLTRMTPASGGQPASFDSEAVVFRLVAAADEASGEFSILRIGNQSQFGITVSSININHSQFSLMISLSGSDQITTVGASSSLLFGAVDLEREGESNTWSAAVDLTSVFDTHFAGRAIDLYVTNADGTSQQEIAFIDFVHDQMSDELEVEPRGNPLFEWKMDASIFNYAHVQLSDERRCGDTCKTSPRIFAQSFDDAESEMIWRHEGDALQQGEYFWRVKSCDTEANCSITGWHNLSIDQVAADASASSFDPDALTSTRYLTQVPDSRKFWEFRDQDDEGNEDLSFTVVEQGCSSVTADRPVDEDFVCPANNWITHRVSDGEWSVDSDSGILEMAMTFINAEGDEDEDVVELELLATDGQGGMDVLFNDISRGGSWPERLVPTDQEMPATTGFEVEHGDAD